MRPSPSQVYEGISGKGMEQEAQFTCISELQPHHITLPTHL